MIVEASITGVIRTVLILIGILVVLRFLGQLMNAKRNMEEERELNKRSRQQQSERERVQRNFGRTQVNNRVDYQDGIEDVDFEEVE